MSAKATEKTDFFGLFRVLDTDAELPPDLVAWIGEDAGRQHVVDRLRRKWRGLPIGEQGALFPLLDRIVEDVNTSPAKAHAHGHAHEK